MFVYIWRFEVEPGRERDFERAYGPRGQWTHLFSTATGFLGSQLLREAPDGRSYLTIDRWISEAARRAFLDQAGAAYRRLDEQCAELTRSETEIGAFEAI